MPPKSGKGKAREVATAAPRRSARSRKNASTVDATLDVYGSMVAEAVAAEPVESSDRPLKRRRTSRGPITPAKTVPKKQELNTPNETSASTPANETSESYQWDEPPRTRPPQTVEYSSESEESDLAFEDIDLGQRADSSPPPAPETDEGIKDVDVSLAPPSASKKAAANRRKPATTVEKAFRLRIHKIHFLTLLGHCMYVNSRCNNATVQTVLRRLVDKRMRSYLHPKPDDSQFQRNRSFMDGLEQAKAAFKAEYKITMSGMSRPRWSMGDGDEGPSSGGEPMDLADFAMAARDLEGSQDTGNQLFCAMLRAVGVEARIVCSLQTLPYASPPAKSTTPQKKKKPTVFAIASDTDPNLSDASASASDGSIGSSAAIGKIPSVRRRLGQPSFTTSPKVAPPREKNKEIRTLSYPVYWVEAFNTAHQKWVPVDPMVTNTVNKPTKIEPPASYDLNHMIYVVAFEEDGVARDVTRRYAKAFNAKTRRHRIENSGEDGAKWLKAAFRLFRRRRRLDRDQVEDSELAQKEAREGLPSNVLDFKGHPYYALERHLRRHEVLHPRREAGKVNAGTAARPKMEPVFRRQDVFSCKSADKWYRLGRKVIQGEQPLKHIPARASRRRDLDDEANEAEPSMTGLYSINQTQVYVPPAIKGGKITKNAFGNLDVYVPSMVPPGGEHIRHALTQQAARALNIDFADAVVGFKFQGRQGTAIIEGAVVPREYSDAVRAVIAGLEHEALEEASKSRSLVALRLWSRFLRGLRIAERVSAYGDGSAAENVDGMDVDEIDFADGVVSNVPEAQDPTMPTAGQYSAAELIRPSKPARKPKKRSYDSDTEYDNTPMSSSRPRRHNRGIPVIEDDEDYDYTPNGDGDDGGGFLPEDAQEVMECAGGFVPDAGDEETGGGFVPDYLQADESQGGGFLLEGAGDHGGGFVHEGESVDELGGGFVPETIADETGAGGFLVEESGIGNDDGGTSGDPSQDVAMLDATGDDNRTITDLPGTLDERKPSPDMTTQTPASDEGNTLMTNTTNAEQLLAEVTSARAPQRQTTQSASEQETVVPLDNTSMNEDVGSNSDRDSLISHDPEDDDAEPDWLESD